MLVVNGSNKILSIKVQEKFFSDVSQRTNIQVSDHMEIALKNILEMHLSCIHHSRLQQEQDKKLEVIPMHKAACQCRGR